MCPVGSRGAWPTALGTLDALRRAAAEPHIGAVGAGPSRGGVVLEILDLMAGAVKMWLPAFPEWSSLGGHSRLHVDITAVGTCISACRQRWAKALQLLAEVCVRGLQQSGIATNAAITACSHGHRWAAAVQLNASGITGINSVAKACEHGLHWDRVLSLMQGMWCQLIRCDVFSCSTSVSACSRTQHWEHAMDVWSEMQVRLVRPNEVAYGAACSASQIGFAETLELLGEMEQRRLAKNLIICNIQLSSYAARSRWQEAISLLEQMDADHATQSAPAPNLISLRSVASAAGSAQRGMQSRQLFGRLQALIDELLPFAGSHAGRKSFSSLVLVNSAIEALELLDSYDELRERSVLALQTPLVPVVSKLLHLQRPNPGGQSGDSQGEASQQLGSIFNLGTFLLPFLQRLHLSPGSAWLCRARSFSRQGHGHSDEPKAQELRAWRAARLVIEARKVGVTGGVPLELQHGSAVVRYGGDAAPFELLPVLVDHDRSRHSERQVLLMLLALLRNKARDLEAAGQAEEAVRALDGFHRAIAVLKLVCPMAQAGPLIEGSPMPPPKPQNCFRSIPMA
eukprot:Skav234846  [mRNA]  locus=scaffold1355:110989:115699:+ [translate_table: standard]